MPFPARALGTLLAIFPFLEAVMLSPPFKTWQRGLEPPMGVAECAWHSVYLAWSGYLVGGFH